MAGVGLAFTARQLGERPAVGALYSRSPSGGARKKVCRFWLRFRGGGDSGSTGGFESPAFSAAGFKQMLVAEVSPIPDLDEFDKFRTARLNLASKYGVACNNPFESCSV